MAVTTSSTKHTSSSSLPDLESNALAPSGAEYERLLETREGRSLIQRLQRHDADIRGREMLACQAIGGCQRIAVAALQSEVEFVRKARAIIADEHVPPIVAEALAHCSDTLFADLQVAHITTARVAARDMQQAVSRPLDSDRPPSILGGLFR